MPYKSKRKQRKATRASVARWYQAHKAERAAYMREYRRRTKELPRTVRERAAPRRRRRRGVENSIRTSPVAKGRAKRRASSKRR